MNCMKDALSMTYRISVALKRRWLWFHRTRRRESPPVPENSPALPEGGPLGLEQVPVGPERFPQHLESSPLRLENAPLEVETAPAGPDRTPLRPEASPLRSEKSPAQHESLYLHAYRDANSLFWRKLREHARRCREARDAQL